MVTTLKPEKPEDVLKAVAWAAAEHKPLQIAGGGTKTGIGRPMQTDHTLDLSGLSGISLYEPEELVLTAGPGTPLADIKATLAEKKQELAFEPPNLQQFFGQDDEVHPTIGGIVAGNLSGPRRIRAGAVRDHLLGLKMVTGRGQAIASGGRVMKNVTGYDLCKGLAGSWGTLGVLTEVTLKVLPRAETTCTLLVFGLDAETATRVMSASLGSSADVSGAAHILPPASARSKVLQVRNAGTSVTAIRIEGFPGSVSARTEHLENLLKSHGELVKMDDGPSRLFWAEVRDLKLLPPLPKKNTEDAQVIWRISTTPSMGHQLVDAVSTETGADAVYDWGGGLIWLAQPELGNGNVSAIRGVLDTLGGHTTLYRAPADLRGAIDVFQPQPGPVAALTSRLKAAFDPHGVLNPNRMYPGV